MKVFSADLSDLDWMHTMYTHAANNGHFNVEFKAADFHSESYSIFKRVIEHRQMTQGRKAQAMVFENNSQRIGFAIVSEIEPGVGGTELHILLVDEMFRGRGFGKMMLAEIVQRWNSVSDIHVVCFKNSVIMKHLLETCNFIKLVETTDEACTYILYKQIKKPA